MFPGGKKSELCDSFLIWNKSIYQLSDYDLVLATKRQAFLSELVLQLECPKQKYFAFRLPTPTPFFFALKAGVGAPDVPRSAQGLRSPVMHGEPFKNLLNTNQNLNLRTMEATHPRMETCNIKADDAATVTLKTKMLLKSGCLGPGPKAQQQLDCPRVSHMYLSITMRQQWYQTL